jgi:ammonium transporter Rh
MLSLCLGWLVVGGWWLWWCASGVENMLNGLFCAGACLISFGALIGKVSPLQLLVLIIVEPFFYWLNFFVGYIKLEAVDIGTHLIFNFF